MAGKHLTSGQYLRLYTYISLISLLIHFSQAQQSYVNNKQLRCEVNETTTLGYNCSSTTTPGCLSYVTFRSISPYNTPVSIAYLLNTSTSEIARLNNLSDISTIPPNTLVLVPLNCSCSAATVDGGPFYQHQTSYTLKFTGETYFSVANNTYQGLSTCQSMISQNSYNYRNLVANMKLNVPLRCACPSKNQSDNGYKYLLSYLITWNDNVDQIADTFSLDGADKQSILEANEIASDKSIFPFTPLLIPLKKEPARMDLSVSPPPPSPASPTLPVNPTSGGGSSHKGVFIGVGIGAGLLLIGCLLGFLVLFLRRRSRKEGSQTTPAVPNRYADYHNPVATGGNDSSSWSITSDGVRYAINSLAHYKFEELQEATGFFGEANRIKGSVYKGFFKGDLAAVKIMRGDVSSEINVLKQINHSNIIRLSGYCVHQGKSYLVYEYAEKGSVSDVLHELSLAKTDETMSPGAIVLGWIQRVQIAYDIGDALNYLHNCINPPFIHKNLTTSNVLLDSNLRTKVANFRLARSLIDSEEGGGMQLTRHVVGTYGCLAPEYIENGLITPKLDVYAFGIVMLELLSGRQAVQHKSNETGKEDDLLSATIIEVLGGENVREKLGEFMDPCLKKEYPLDLAYSMAQLARSCVANDLNSRPTSAEVFMTLSKIHSSSLDWDPSDELEYSRSMSYGR